MAPYVLTGTEGLAAMVAEAGRTANCILLENHGVTCLGDSLLRAFDRLELIEAAARMTIITRQLDGVHSLDAAQCRDLDRLMGRYS
jgi:L-fuculose-phosphate aldolase